MRDYLPFVVIGITTGSLYGLAGLGLVLTYRTSGIFNFAHGAVAAAAAYLFHSLHNTWGWPWPIATLVSVLLFGAVAGIFMEQIARRMAGARTATITVATVGLLLFIQGTLSWAYGADRILFPEFLPTKEAFTFSDVIVTWSQVINVAVGVCAFLGLYVFLRLTRLGMAMKAVVADPDLLGLAGTDPVRVRVVSWIIGCAVASITGILIAPTLGLDALLLSALVVQAFGAVAIGRFASLPVTYLGGLAIGVLAAIATKEFAARPPLNGIPGVVPFLVLIAVMLLTPGGKLPAGAGRLSGQAPRAQLLPRRARTGLLAVSALVLALIPELVGSRLPVYTTGLVFALLFLSLGLLTGVSGQISLAHAAFAGVGAAVFSNLTADVGLPWAGGVVGAGIVTAGVGALLALPAMRLSGVYLALATYGFGLLMDGVIFHTWLLFGQSAQGGLPGRRPGLGALLDPRSDTAYYYVVLAVVVGSAVFLLALRRARLGRYLRAMADSGTALRTMGLSTNVTRILVFATSAFFAGVAGALYLGQIGQLSALSFNSAYSLLYLAIFVVAGVVSGFVVPAFLAAALLVIVPSYLTGLTLEVQSMIFGGVALIAAMFSDGRVDWARVRRRAASRFDDALERSERRRADSPVTARLVAGEAEACEVMAGPTPAGAAR